MDYKWRVVMVAMMGDFLVSMDTTLMNVALPTIIRAFDTTINRAQLVVTMYLFAIAVAVPLTGFLTDRFGSKRVYVMCLVGFTSGAALCTMSWDINSLIFFRIVQGVAGGLLMPLGVALIFRAVPREQHGLAMALFVFPVVIAPIFGPILSGYLIETWNWRFIWLPHLPLGIMAMFVASMMLRETQRLGSLPFDYKGFILAGVGFCAALLALTRVAQDGWTANGVVGLFIVSGTALSAWVYVELHEKDPLLDLRIFRNFTYTRALSIFLVSSVVMVTLLFMLPLFLQHVRGLSPIQTALLLMPEAMALGAGLFVGGRLYDKIGPLPLIIPGLLGVAYAMFQLHNLDVTTSDGTLIKILMLRGAAGGLMVMPAFTLAMSVHPAHAVARASALTSVLRQMVPAIGIAFFVTLLQNRQAFHFSNLAQTVTPDSLAVMQVISRLKESAGQLGASDAVTSQAAIQVLDGVVQQQAMVNAFNDVFLITAFLALFAIPVAIFLRKPKTQVEVQTGGAALAPEPAD